MAYILDGVVILIFLLSVWIGYRRGFFKSVIQLVGCFAAAAIAFTVSTPIADSIYSGFVEKRIQDALIEKIEEAKSDAVEGTIKAVEEMPSSIGNLLKLFKLDTEQTISKAIDGATDSTVPVIAAKVEREVIRPAAITLIRVICFGILFILLMIGIGIAAKIIDKVLKLPVLKQVNGSLGAVIGAVEGIIIVLVAVLVMNFMAATADAESIITTETMEDTILVSRLSNINPLTAVFGPLNDALEDTFNGEFV